MVGERREDGVHLEGLGGYTKGESRAFTALMAQGVDRVKRHRQVVHRCTSGTYSRRKETRFYMRLFAVLQPRVGSEDRMVAQRDRRRIEPLYIP